MGSTFHHLCPRYSGTLTATAATAIRNLYLFLRKGISFDIDLEYVNQSDNSAVGFSSSKTIPKKT